MAVSKEEVDAWFASNPNATGEQVAAAVQSIGGLSANAGLADILATRFTTTADDVNKYYDNFVNAPGALAQANGSTQIDNSVLANSFDFSNSDYSGLQNLDANAVAGLKAIQTDGTGADSSSVGAPVDVVSNLASQILGQGKTQYWTGEGGGSTDTNALWMADRLYKGAGITDINDFGLITTKADVAVTPVYEYDAVQGQDGEAIQVPRIVGYKDANGNPVDPSLVKTQDTYSGEGDAGTSGIAYVAPVGTQQVYGNLKTGQALDAQYDRANKDQGIWSGTFAGKDSTHYGVQFTPDGKPIFYTQQGESTSDAATLIPIISLGLNLLLPGAGAAVGTALGATGAAATIVGNAVIQGALSAAGGGDFVKGALSSAVGSVAGNYITPEIANALGNTDVANVVAKTITGGALAAANGQDAGVGALTGGVGAVTSLALPNIPGFNELSAGAKNSIVNLTTNLVTNGTITEAQALNALGGIVASTLQTGTVPNAKDFEVGYFLPGGEGYVPDAGAAAYTAAINAGANEEEALAASRAVTGGTGTATSVSTTTNNTVDSGTGNDIITGGAGGDAVTTVTGGTSKDTIAGGTTKDTEFGDLDGAIATNAMDDAVRADKLNVISEAPKFGDAYSQARELLGAGQTFMWKGKTYSTDTREENASLAAASDATRLNNIASSVTAGGGRGSAASYAGYDVNAAADNYSKAVVPKTLAGGTTGGDAVNDAVYDQMGNLISGSMGSADPNSVLGKATTAFNNALGSVVQTGLSNLAKAGGEQLASFGGALATIGVADADNVLVKAGKAADQFGSAVETAESKAGTKNIVDAVSAAEGIGGKFIAGLKAGWENPTAALNLITREGFQEVLPVGLALKASKIIGIGAAAGLDTALNASESMGSAYNDAYQGALSKGLSKEQADSLATNVALSAGAITLVTSGLVDATLVKTVFREGSGSVGKNIATGSTKEGVSEGIEETATALATQYLTTGKIDWNDATTQGVIGQLVGKTTAGTVGTVDASVSGSTGSTDLGAVGSVVPGADKVAGSTDLGAVGSVVPGADSVTSGASTAAATDFATIFESTGNTTQAVDTAVGTAISNGADADSTISSVVDAASTTGASANVAAATATNAAVAAGTDVATASNAATTAVSNASTGADTGTATGANTNTATDANSNTSTNANTGVTTTTAVDANTGTATTTTTNADTNTSTTVTSNSNTGTTTTNNTNNNTGIDTTIVVDTNNNTTTNTVTNVTTGEVVKVNTDTTTGEVVNVDGPGEVIDQNTVVVDGVVIDITTGEILTPAEVEKRKTASKSKSAPTTKKKSSATAGASANQPNYDAKDSDIEETWLGGMFRNAAPLAAMGILMPESNPMFQDSQALSALRRASGVEDEPRKPEADYYAYGSEPSFSKVLQPYMKGGTVQEHAEGGKIMASPLMAASGGDVQYKGSHYVQGAGGGQDDLIPAKLADGEYVFDAEIVAALGDGSNKEGAKKLDAMREAIRRHKRGGSVKTIPPKAKSPLAYLKESTK